MEEIHQEIKPIEPLIIGNEKEDNWFIKLINTISPICYNGKLDGLKFTFKIGKK